MNTGIGHKIIVHFTSQHSQDMAVRLKYYTTVTTGVGFRAQRNEVRPKDYRTVTTGVGFRAQCEGVRQKKLLDCYYRCVGSEFSVKESDKKNYRTVTTDVWVQSSV